MDPWGSHCSDNQAQSVSSRLSARPRAKKKQKGERNMTPNVNLQQVGFSRAEELSGWEQQAQGFLNCRIFPLVAQATSIYFWSDWVQISQATRWVSSLRTPETPIKALSFLVCFVLFLFLFLFSLGCQPISWCCPYIRWAFLLSESSLETLSQSHPEVCLLGDSKSSQVASEEEPSQSSGGRLCHWTDED